MRKKQQHQWQWWRVSILLLVDRIDVTSVVAFFIVRECHVITQTSVEQH